MAIERTGYWTFFCSPDKWEIDRFLETNPYDDIYQVTEWQRNDFMPGQLGVIRVGVDKRNKTQLKGHKKLLPGIYAIVEITSKPYARRDNPDMFWNMDKWTEKERAKPIVNIRYLKNLLHSPLLLSEIKNDLLISNDKYLVRGFQAPSMPLKQNVYKKISTILEPSSEHERQIVLTVEQTDFNDYSSISKLAELYKTVSPTLKQMISKRIERGTIAQQVKKLCEYKCLVCQALGNNPYTFEKRDSQRYIETHHIVPVSNLQEGLLAISNLLTVCANHHRQLHYGNVEILSNTPSSLLLKIDGKEIKINKKILPGQ